MGEIKKMWACWKVGTGQPSVQHDSKDAAMAEAARIAAKTGVPVIILESVGFVEPLAPPTRYTDL